MLMLGCRNIGMFECKGKWVMVDCTYRCLLTTCLFVLSRHFLLETFVPKWLMYALSCRDKEVSCHMYDDTKSSWKWVIGTFVPRWRKVISCVCTIMQSRDVEMRCILRVLYAHFMHRITHLWFLLPFCIGFCIFQSFAVCSKGATIFATPSLALRSWRSLAPRTGGENGQRTYHYSKSISLMSYLVPTYGCITSIQYEMPSVR